MNTNGKPKAIILPNKVIISEGETALVKAVITGLKSKDAIALVVCSISVSPFQIKISTLGFY